jgi:hypothetical protein
MTCRSIVTKHRKNVTRGGEIVTTYPENVTKQRYNVTKIGDFAAKCR